MTSTQGKPAGKSPADFAQSGKGLRMTPQNPLFVPRLGDTQGLICVALTTIIMAHAGIFGMGSILVFFAIWFSRIKYRGVFLLRLKKDLATVMIFPVYACISTVWSQVPQQSLYTALEYTSAILCAIIIARLVRTVVFIRGFLLGGTLVLIASLLSGNYGMDPFSGYYSLVGWFGSKNQVGLFAELGVFFAFSAFFYKQSTISRTLFCIIPLVVSLIAMHLSKSASSVLSLIIVFGMVFAAYLVTRLPRSYRGFATAGVCVWFLALLIAGVTLDWQDAILSSFGKDATLTGRTLLWSKGWEAGWTMPFIGHGYSAFWVQGNPPAESLWFEFGIPERAGFHFHNLFVEIFVEVGIVGVLMFTLLLLQNVTRSFRSLLRNGMDIEYIFALGLSVMFLVRACVEVDLVGTFGIGPILFYAIIPRLATYEQEKRALAQTEKT